MRTWSAPNEERPLRRLQRLLVARIKTDPTMHRATRKLAHSECEWKHSAKGIRIR